MTANLKRLSTITAVVLIIITLQISVFAAADVAGTDTTSVVYSQGGLVLYKYTLTTRAAMLLIIIGAVIVSLMSIIAIISVNYKPKNRTNL